MIQPHDSMQKCPTVPLFSAHCQIQMQIQMQMQPGHHSDPSLANSPIHTLQLPQIHNSPISSTE